MQSLAKPSYLFSAYPLKAYKGYSEQKAPKTNLRIFPMKNPYRIPTRITPPDPHTIPSDIEVVDKTWFNHYE